jgi:predicted DNA-binding WGR domain protein
VSRREFRSSEGGSNKFWAIEQAGKAHTVHFGRVGTAGQTQTKDFGSEEDARKSCEKLVAEKLRKGYVEVNAGPQAAAPPTTKTAMPGPKTVAEPPPTPPAAPVSTAVTHSIALDPEDGFWVTWHKRPPLPRPAEPPFHFETCRQRLAKVKPNSYGWMNWEKAAIGPILSRREAHFWFLALTENMEKTTPADVAATMNEQQVTGEIDVEEAVKRLTAPRRLEPVLPQRCLFNLLDPANILDFLLRFGAGTEILSEFTRHVFPYLGPDDLKGLESTIRPRLDPKEWPTDYYQRPPMQFFLAALLGMHDDLLRVVRSIPDDFYAGQKDWDRSHYHKTQRLVFGLGSPDLVETETRRLRLPLRRPEFLRAWLALTEFAALDYARDNILAETKREVCEQLLQVFCLVKAPEAALHILELKLSSKAPGLARQWLDEHVGNAVAGLIPVAAGRGKLAEAAVEYLREAKKKGHEALIRDCLQGAPVDVAESVRKNVLGHEEKEYPPLDTKTTPAPLKAAFEAKERPGKLPAWVTATGMPPVVVGGRRLTEEQVTAVLEALQHSTLEKPDPLIAALKQHADAASLDAFAWKLFQLWQAEGSPSKEKWAMGAVGLLGGDASALRLTPLVRNWPGESQHQRAVFSLDCLRVIGTDTALMQLNGIAQKLKFKALKQRATEAMEAIAKEKGLTKTQLEDRIVPDCDLDERGSRSFDFGPRQFRFVLGPGMRPMLKDADGKVRDDLPKPDAKDDTAKAAEAAAAWKLLKKQVKEVATIQAGRLEQAVVTGRRWSVPDFETLLVRHPLMINLVRLLLWGGYDKQGQLTSTFRVTEDQTYADSKDREYQLRGVESVGIVHPLHLTEEQRSAWGEVFSDYEIVPPFPQLGRTIYRLEKDEQAADELKRFAGLKLPAPTLVFTLEKFGWARGLAMDAGCFDEHSKPFPAADVTAVVHYEGTVGMGYIDPNEELKIEGCYFAAGHRPPAGYAYKEETVKLGDVDPVAVSEVLADLTALAAKAK